MKIHPQIISQKGAPIFVVIPYQEYEAILTALEDIVDVEAVLAAQADTSERFPLDIVERVAAGENKVKVFREYRNLSQVKLAKQIGVSRQYISQIESGERVGTTKLLKKIAENLGVGLDDIT